MNYGGFNIYARNRGQHATGHPDRREALPVTRQVRCPFCMADVLEIDGRIKMHIEWRGFTVCPVSGHTLEAATLQAQSLMDEGDE